MKTTSSSRLLIPLILSAALSLSSTNSPTVQKHGHSKVKIVGHDWGGAVGYIYAARYRYEVTQLAFMS
jgi:alpha-beta hydrolase superfamily lysophospholipase